jgi:hypothetical protein
MSFGGEATSGRCGTGEGPSSGCDRYAALFNDRLQAQRWKSSRTHSPWAAPASWMRPWAR